MFEGYQTGLDTLNPGREDIVIMCHDDIEILSDRTVFKQILEQTLAKKSVGFVGPAGTTSARRETIDQIGLAKPKEFPTNWDFYDLYYTLSAYEQGFNNKAVPIVILHNSNGYMRETWEANRTAFRKMFRLPVGCR